MIFDVYDPLARRVFCGGCYALPMMCLLSWPATASDAASVVRIYSQIDVQAHAEPVPVMDMVEGWDGPFQSGRFAFGDARLITGLAWQDWFVEREQRWHYDLSFSRGMSRYYNALERGESLAADESLRLDVRSIEAWGARVGRTFQWRSPYGEIQLQPALALYRVGHFQFGQLSGAAEAGEEERASARLRYFYDEDKILEHDPFVPKGWGASLDLTLAWQQAHWQTRLTVRDLANRWQWQEAAFTTACINFNDPTQSICSSSGTASGRSGQQAFIARLTPTLSASMMNRDWHTEISADWHGDYRQLGVTQFIFNERLGVSAHSTRQLGIQWRSDWLSFYWKADDIRLSYARDLDIGLGIQLSW